MARAIECFMVIVNPICLYVVLMMGGYRECRHIYVNWCVGNPQKQVQGFAEPAFLSDNSSIVRLTREIMMPFHLVRTPPQSQ